ncbi:MAG: hypothetical protein JO121_19455 [Deltaproteobacteria bacterium]|nr:hypothetical protein [Deltaproteobacteria bacterium]MBV8226878.1 hypothetical protein [Verrucomicrobiota bacterium]
MAAAIPHGFAALGRWARKEFNALLPVFVFFLVGFILLILLLKAALAEFSIEVSVLSNAIIGALLAAKAALVLDETPLGRSLQRYRRIVEIAAKVLFYGITCLLFLYAERVLEARHKFPTWGVALLHAYQQLSQSILVWSLGISIVFALYFVFAEISEQMGQGELWKLLLESRTNGTDSCRPSKIGVAKGRS